MPECVTPSWNMKSEQFKRRIEDEKVEGWKVKDDGDERVVMIKPDYGSFGEHLLILILTIWSFGLGNACWAAYRYFRSSDKNVVRDEQATAGQTQSSEPSIVTEEPETGERHM